VTGAALSEIRRVLEPVLPRPHIHWRSIWVTSLVDEHGGCTEPADRKGLGLTVPEGLLATADQMVR
jgi:hypothetical protein